jgi:hypothetical protein
LLPQHYIWVDWMGKSFSRNLVPSGTFDEFSTLESLESAGWTDVSRPFEGVTAKIGTVRSSRDGKRLLKISVKPTDEKKVDTLPPFLDYPVGAIRSPEIKVKAGQFLKISVDLAKRIHTNPGHGGVIIRDSIGGEPLQFRYSDPILELTKTVLFRRAPADGVVTVTLGMASYGDVFFNDFKVEVAEGPAESAPADLAAPSPSRPPLPDPSTPPFPDPPMSSTASRPIPVPRTNR